MPLLLRLERNIFRASTFTRAFSWTTNTPFKFSGIPIISRFSHIPIRDLPTPRLGREDLVNMANYFKSLNPTPSFPDYTGPYKVGTIDVEIPVSELKSPSPQPASAEGLDTVLFRIWYPCVDDHAKKHERITWLPNPQREHIAAYSRFLGGGKTASTILSFFPRIMHYVSPPARKNAKLHPSPQPDSRWPLMIFSHGLGGNRNTYSHVAGSIASHGMVVITPEHRDGSAPVSYSRKPGSMRDKDSKTVEYKKVPHAATPEVHEIRTAQLETRLWELGLIHDALIRIEAGTPPTNSNTSSVSLLPIFASKLAISKPGSIAFAGHSFGAATVSQFIKSIFYSPYTDAPADFMPLYNPAPTSEIKKQITPQTPLALLDIWLLPLRAPSSRYLWNLPLPSYAPSGPGGGGLLAIESQAFWKWRVHLKLTKRFLGPDPDCTGTGKTCDRDGRTLAHMYYAEKSAHLSQSDFGILFPWVTRKMMGVEEPERVLRLNVRAVLQLLRDSGVPVAETSRVDMELEVAGEPTDSTAAAPAAQDRDIFSTDGAIRGWHWLDLDVSDMEDVKAEDEEKTEEHGQGEGAMGGGEGQPTEAVVENEVMAGERKERGDEKL